MTDAELAAFAPVPASAEKAAAKAAGLSFWSGAVEPRPLTGGLTNRNFIVDDPVKGRFVVRIGGDIPMHGIMRFNELAFSRASAAAGTGPEIVHAEPGALVMHWIEGRTYAAEDVRDPANLPRIARLLRKVHDEVGRHLLGPALAFWPFYVNRSYILAIARAGGGRQADKLERFAVANAALERAVGAIEPVACHNDLLPANFLDDGKRLWLIDWDYGGFNSVLFDLANLAGNNDFEAGHERDLLALYYDGAVPEGAWRQFAAMKCASVLRETVWSAASEVYPSVGGDYAAYTDLNLARFEAAYGAWSAS
ncbi:phosphotransferase [Zavarzinia sp. CC-PAN008]|uniref:phosphotransferase n=1 Tax=Zavarzinia sp. CC-PAN008 TaxID=3243332 RepID=UPI003F74A1F3